MQLCRKLCTIVATLGWLHSKIEDHKKHWEAQCPYFGATMHSYLLSIEGAIVERPIVTEMHVLMAQKTKERFHLLTSDSIWNCHRQRLRIFFIVYTKQTCEEPSRRVPSGHIYNMKIKNCCKMRTPTEQIIMSTYQFIWAMKLYALFLVSE